MSDQTIKCPKCGTKIPLSEALTNQIENSIRAQYEEESAKKAQDLEKEKQALKRQQKELEKQKESISEQVEEQIKEEKKKIAADKKVIEKQRQEIEDTVSEQVEAERKKIANQKKELDNKRKQIDEEIAEREKELRSTLTKQLRAKITEEQSVQTKALEQELEEKNKQIIESNKKELELRKQHQKLEEEKAAVKLTVQRQLDEERKKIYETASQKAAEEQQLKLRERDDQIEAMKKQLDEMRRKADVGSQERQGEALEGTLQDTLQQAFPYDSFEEIKKGQRGADILQIVRNSTGKECGKILWESKNTKDFSSKWIEKIKTDQQDANADMSVIMSMALPKGIDNFGPFEGIWVTDYKSTIGLCNAFRETLIRVERERVINKHQDSMRDVLYKYVTGQEFAMRIKRMAEAYIGMQRDLEAEKRAMNKIWSKREKQISTVLDNLSGIRGEIEGMVGGQKILHAIETLSLEAITEEEEIEKD